MGIPSLKFLLSTNKKRYWVSPNCYRVARHRVWPYTLYYTRSILICKKVATEVTTNLCAYFLFLDYRSQRLLKW